VRVLLLHAPAQVALRQDLGAAQAVALKLDEMYQLADKEAAQARLELKAQEDDRQFLVRCVPGSCREAAPSRACMAAARQQPPTAVPARPAARPPASMCRQLLDDRRTCCTPAGSPSCKHVLACRQLLDYKRANHQLKQQVEGLQQQLDSIMALAAEEQQAFDEDAEETGERAPAC